MFELDKCGITEEEFFDGVPIIFQVDRGDANATMITAIYDNNKILFEVSTYWSINQLRLVTQGGEDGPITRTDVIVVDDFNKIGDAINDIKNSDIITKMLYEGENKIEYWIKKDKVQRILASQVE